ncbi:MAG: hypothetical protein ABIH00_07000 [Armatimonadota bacterium]
MRNDINPQNINDPYYTVPENSNPLPKNKILSIQQIDQANLSSSSITHAKKTLNVLKYFAFGKKTNNLKFENSARGANFSCNFEEESCGGGLRANKTLNYSNLNPVINTNVDLKQSNTSFHLNAGNRGADIKFQKSIMLGPKSDFIDIKLGYTPSIANPAKISSHDDRSDFIPRLNREAMNTSRNAQTSAEVSALVNLHHSDSGMDINYKYRGDEQNPKESLFSLNAPQFKIKTPVKNGKQQCFAVDAAVTGGRRDNLPYTSAEFGFSGKTVSYTPRNGESYPAGERSLFKLNARLESAQRKFARYDEAGGETTFSAPVNTFSLNGSLSATPTTNISGSYSNTVYPEKPALNSSNLDLSLEQKLGRGSNLDLNYNETSSSGINTRTYSATYRNPRFEVSGRKTETSFGEYCPDKESSYSLSSSVRLDPSSSLSLGYENDSRDTKTYSLSYRKMMRDFLLDFSASQTEYSSGEKSNSVFLNSGLRF